MARKRVYTESITVPLTKSLQARIEKAAEVGEVAMADIVRDCVEASLPSIELQLGLVDLDDMEDAVLEQMGITRTEVTAPIKENRAAGCFGGPPLPPA